MEVSTRTGSGPGEIPDVGIRLGARHAMRLAALFAPSLLPLLPLAVSLLTLPWLDSIEAGVEREFLSLEIDAAARDGLAAITSAFGGPIGLGVIGALLCSLWLAALRSWKAWSPRGIARALLARFGTRPPVLFAVLATAAVSTAGIQWAAGRLGRWVDLATAVRPMGSPSLLTIVASQAITLLALGACAGATVAALEVARMPRARLGAAGILLTLGALGMSIELAATAWLAHRCDLRRSLQSVLAPSGEPGRAVVVVAARDRSWRLPMIAGISRVPFDEEHAARAEALLEARSGWTRLAPDLEAYVLGERLMALDPGAAQASALRAVARRGTAATGYHLLASLGTTHPSDASRQILETVTTAPWLRRGPLALHLLSAAACAQGDRAAAESALARLRGMGAAPGRAQSQGALSLVLSDFTDGRVHGRILLDGAPLRGRIGLVAVQDLFELPPAGEPVPFTWLLRLGAAVDPGADGTFAFEHVIPGEHALVLVERDGPVAFPELPPIAPTRDARAIDLGTIELRRER